MTERRVPTRERVLACIRAYPGIHLRAVERELALSSALVHYHVKQLEKQERIVTASVGGYLRLYPKDPAGGRGMSGEDQALLAVLREEVPLHIALILLEDEVRTQASLQEDLGLAKSTVSYHVEKLASRGVVVRRETTDGDRVLRLREPARVRRLLGNYGPTTDLLEKFRSVWDDFYGT